MGEGFRHHLQETVCSCYWNELHSPSVEDVLVNKEILFTVKKYTTSYYSEHSSAFVIQKISELCTVYQRELYHYIPLHTGPNYWNRISCCFKNSRFYSINNDHSCRTILYIHWD